jgi:hypothetical protein
MLLLTEGSRSRSVVVVASSLILLVAAATLCIVLPGGGATSLRRLDAARQVQKANLSMVSQFNSIQFN